MAEIVKEYNLVDGEDGDDETELVLNVDRLL
jgi:hypothetical protein